MKRHAQMKRAGAPRPGTFRKIKMRGIGKPKREWLPGPLIIERPIRHAREMARQAEIVETLKTRGLDYLRKAIDGGKWTIEQVKRAMGRQIPSSE